MTEIDPQPDAGLLTLPWWRTTPGLIALVGVVAAAVVGGLVALGVVSIGDDEGASSSRSAAVDPGALVAARQEALAFFSLDYRTVSADVEEVLALATGDFKEEYEANKAQVIAQVQDKKLIAMATIPDNGVAVEFASGDEARILVVVDVARTIGTQADRLRNRARLLLQRVDGAWLVAGVNQVG